MGEFGSSTTSFAMPQHPLPDEIQSMEPDETVCKFCGVSYLIHNEVKALQERLAEAERTMEYYKGSVDREKVLIEKMRDMEEKYAEQMKTAKEQDQQLELFKGDIKMKASLINDMYSEKHRLKEDLKQSKEKSDSLQSQLSKLVATLPKMNNIVHKYKDSLNNLRKQALEQKALLNDKVKSITSYLEGICIRLTEKVDRERQENKMNIQDLNEQLSRSQTSLSKLSGTDKQMHELQTKCLDLQSKVENDQKETSNMVEQIKVLHEKCTALEKELDNKLNEITKLKNDIEVVKTETKYEQMRHNEGIAKKDEEIERLGNLCKSLEKVLNEKSTKEMETREKVTGKNNEVKVLEKSLSQIKLDNENLRLEREQTIVAHHNRIEQLRESYSKKLGQTETSYSKLRQEFDRQQKIIEKDFEEEKAEMREKFEKVKEDLISKHNQQLKLLQAEIKECNDKLEHEENTCKNAKDQLCELKNTLSTTKAQNAQEVQKYQNDLLEVRRKAEDAEQRRRELASAAGPSSDKYRSVQKCLQDANAHIKTLKEQLKANKDKMTVLQNTVRQECEERLGLTQALSNARMQLLTSQQNSGTSRRSPNTKPNAPRFVAKRQVPTSAVEVTNNTDDRTTITTSVVQLGKGNEYRSTGSNHRTRSTGSDNISTGNEHRDTGNVYRSTGSDLPTGIPGNERRTRSTGSDVPSASRESVDCFRERIAVALGRPSRANVTR